MANGDDAIDAGMPVVLGTEDRRDGYDEINLSRDFIAGGPNYWLTGLAISAPKAASARAALGVSPTTLTVTSNGFGALGLIWDGVNLQFFVNGSFVGYVSLNGPGVGSWGND